MTESCANCRFWLYPSTRRSDPDILRETSACRRRAPLPAASAMYMHSHPSTHGSHWCGEWEAIRETHSGDPKNDDGQTGDGAISYADILVCASIRGNCGTVHSSFEEWKNCRACDLPPLPWSIRAQIFKDEEPPK